jgi:hypothetical protein
VYKTKKTRCPLCARAVCSLTCYPFKIPFEPPAKGELDVCRRCCQIIKKKSLHEDIVRRRQQANESRICLFYETLISLRQDLIHTIPQLRGLIYSLMEAKKMIEEEAIQQHTNNRTQLAETLSATLDCDALLELEKEAHNYKTKINSDFQNLQQRLKKIDEIPTANNTEKRMKENINRMIIMFLKTTRPEVMTLEQQLNLFANSKIVRAKLHERKQTQHTSREYRNQKLQTPHDSVTTDTNKRSHSSNGDDKESDVTNTSLIPFITHVIPCVCPLQGGNQILVKGKNFSRDMRVFVGTTPIEERNILSVETFGFEGDNAICELKFIAPKKERGTYSLILMNKNGRGRAELEEILLYTDDPSILSAFDSNISSTIDNKHHTNNNERTNSFLLTEETTHNISVDHTPSGNLPFAEDDDNVPFIQRWEAFPSLTDNLMCLMETSPSSPNHRLTLERTVQNSEKQSTRLRPAQVNFIDPSKEPPEESRTMTEQTYTKEKPNQTRDNPVRRWGR